MNRNRKREGTRVSFGGVLLSDKAAHEAKASGVCSEIRAIYSNYAIEQISESLMRTVSSVCEFPVPSRENGPCRYPLEVSVSRAA